MQCKVRATWPHRALCDRMKVLLFEQWDGGHYANYLNALVPELARTSDRLVIALSEKMRHSPQAIQSWSLHRNVEFASTLQAIAPGLGMGDRFGAARNLLATLREVRPDFTLLPSADAQSTVSALIHGLGFDLRKRFGPIEGTLHYGYGDAAATSKERLKEALYTQTYKRLPFESVNFVNFAYYEYALKNRLVEPSRMRFVGDPVPQPPRIGRAAARRLLRLEGGGRYLGLLGSLDRRKAVPQLLSAFRAARLAGDDRLLLAGRLDPEYSRLIQTSYADLVRSGRLVVINRFLSDAELESGYEALDLATVVYDRFPGLASLALKAVAAGTPVIAHDFGWLRAAVRRFDIGILTDVFDNAAFASALKRAINLPPLDLENAPLKRLLHFHTEQNFVAQMTSGVKLAGGQAPGQIFDWDWVLQAIPENRRGPD